MSNELTDEHSSTSRRLAGERPKAETNAWYALATVHGEQTEAGINRALNDKNRRMWHGFLCGTSELEERKRLAEFNALNPDEFRPLEHREEEFLRESFAEKGIDFEAMNHSTNWIDLSNLTFANSFFAWGFLFPKSISFRGSIFEGTCDFSEATFLDKLDCQQVGFSSGCRFSRVLFEKDIAFSGSNFGEAASFPLAIFRGRANLERSTFLKAVDCQQADFDGGAFFSECSFTDRVNFIEATFRDTATFRDSFFEKPVNFRGAKFEQSFPDMEGTVLHPFSMFSAERDHWPTHPKNKPSEGKNSCAVIRHILSSQSRVDDAHFFFRCEMWFAERIGNWLFTLPVLLYRILSDYGFSILRPVVGMSSTVILGWIIYLYAFVWDNFINAGSRGGWDAISLSISSTFPFLGFNRLYFSNDYYLQLHPWLMVVTATQSVFGIVFLFFFGLALRNRFRLK